MLRWQESISFLACTRWLLASLAVAVALCGGASARAEPLDLEAGSQSADLTPYIRYLEDADKRLGAREAYALDLERDYRPIVTNLVDFGFTRSRFWLRASVRNATDRAGTWKLVLDVPNIEEISVYRVAPSNGEPPSPELMFSVNDGDGFSARGENYRNFAVDLDLDGREQVELLISYASKQATQLPIMIESPGRFHNRARSEDLHNWTLFALLIGMTLMSTVYVAALGVNTAAYYGAYILLSGLYLFHTDGYGFQYLWPQMAAWNRVAVAPIGLALVASGSLFARAFVDAPRFHPVLNRAILGVVCCTLTLLVLSFALLQFDWFKTGALLFVFLCAGLQLLAGILAIRRGQAGAWLFFCGALAVISSVVFGVFGYLNPGQFNQDIAAHSARYALLFEGSAFAIAVFLHTQTLRRDHDAALRREVGVSAEKLALSEALRSAEAGYSRAVELARSHQARLASTAHDIKQPLTSLRMALMRLNATDVQTAHEIDRSFDYLDSLVQSSLDQPGAGGVDHAALTNEAEDNAPIAPPDGHEGFAEDPEARESFAVSAVLDNVAAMFRDEARARGVDLKLAPSSAQITARPVPLMRMVSNLVSNAIKHAGAGRILIGCRRSDSGLRIEVHDNGRGLPPDECARVLEPYARGDASEGTGLGLAVVADLARCQGMAFSLSSTEGRGTVSVITIPPRAGPLDL